MSSCTSCEAELAEGFRFCPLCGAEQAAPGCVGCGAELPAVAAFCPRCGTRQPGAVVANLPTAARPTVVSERRLAAVLFADLVSYTTLAESRDTEDVRALLSEYFEVCKTVIGRYGGIVEKFIGDAVMAVWGVPTAYEDDAERAVRAGLSLLDAITDLGERLELPQLAMRVGVVTGEVSTTIGAVDQGMVAGDPVNTASRVQSAAGPGELWVDETTRALAASAIAFADVGEHVLKGKAEPVRLFRASAVVAGAGGDQRVDGLEAPLAGRDRELRMIRDLFHATEEAGRPRLVLLDGEAGLGKSRLVAEFLKYVDGMIRETWWHQGRCLSYGEGVSYWALAEMMRMRLGFQDAAGAVDLPALETRIGEWVADEAERSWILPRLASLLGATGGEFDRDDLYAAWTRFIERLGEVSPVVLAIDDAQHADSGLLGFLEFLLTNAKAPIYVLVLARPELRERHPDLGGRRTSVIGLEPLSHGAMGQLVEGLIADISPAARDQIVERADGVPLYAVETVRSLVDRDLVVPRGGRYVVADAAELDLAQIGAPSSLQSLIAARLDALTPDERRVVADASVLGLAFSRDGIELLSGDVPGLDRVLDSLQRKEILTTDTNRFSTERGQYRFVQSVVRQVAYAILSRRDRKERHLRVADYLATQPDAGDVAVVVATHLLDAAEASGADDPDVAGIVARAIGLMRSAADRACSLGSYDDGLRLYLAALERVDAPDLRAELQVRAAETGLEVGSSELVQELAAAALAHYEQVGDLTGAADAAEVLGTALHTAGLLQQAEELLRPLVERLRGDREAEAAYIKVAVGLARTMAWRDLASGDGLQLAREALLLAERRRDAQSIERVLNLLAIVEAQMGSRTVGVALMAHTLETALAQQHWQAAVRAQFNLADIALGDDPVSAAEHARSAVDLATDHGLRRWRLFGAINLATPLWVLGRWDELAGVLTDFGEETADDNPEPGLSSTMALWSLAARAAGREVAEILPGAYDGIDDPQLLLPACLFRAYGELESGDHALAARSAVEAVADPLLRDGATYSDTPWVGAMATDICLEAGDVEAAGTVLAALEALPGERGTRFLDSLMPLLRGRVALARGELDAAASQLGTAIATLTSYDAPPYRAQAHEFHAAVSLRQADPAAAALHAAAAREIYTALGAASWLARLDALMSQPSGVPMEALS